MTEVASFETRKTLENVVVRTVTSPSNIQRIAVDRGINPQEVFVRVTFEWEGKLYSVSNQLRFLNKSGYQELLNAQKTGEPLTFSVDTESGFFYIEHSVSIDDLFAEKIETKPVFADLSTLL